MITAARSLKCTRSWIIIPSRSTATGNLKRTLALELSRLDELEEAFRDKAIVDRDVASGALLVRIAERRATLLGLNPPLGHAVQVIQHEPQNKPTSTERLRAAIDRIRGKTHQDDPPATDQDDPPSTH